MIRFILEKIRTVPGPLKQARVVTADLAEELLDLGRHYLGRRDEVGAPAPRPAHPAPPPAPMPPEPAATAEPPSAPSGGRGGETAKPRKKKGGRAPGTELDLPQSLVAAMEAQGNLRKQDFKILAILWDAGNRDLGPLSAKGISQHGGRIGIPIRHENVRKVIRSRLERNVTIHTEVVGTGTVYRYEMNPVGRAEFEGTYLQSGK